MSKFIVYVLVNIKFWVGCNNLSVPRCRYRRFYKMFQNEQILTLTFSFSVKTFMAKCKELRVWSIFKTRCFWLDIYAVCIPFISYEVKQNTSGFKEFIGRFSYKLQINEVHGQLFDNVLKSTHFQFSKHMFSYVSIDIHLFMKYIALLR
jgi:hypothetical protein